MGRKVCRDCGQEKDESEFFAARGLRGPRTQSYCKVCTGVRSRASLARKREAEKKGVEVRDLLRPRRVVSLHVLDWTKRVDARWPELMENAR